MLVKEPPGRNINLAYRDMNTGKIVAGSKAIKMIKPDYPKSPKQQNGFYDREVVNFVNRFWVFNYRSPSYREIMDACGLNSTSSVGYIIARVAPTENWEILSGNRGIIPAWVRTAISDYSKKHRGYR